MYYLKHYLRKQHFPNFKGMDYKVKQSMEYPFSLMLNKILIYGVLNIIIVEVKFV